MPRRVCLTAFSRREVRPIPWGHRAEVELKISAEGEVMLRSPGFFRYYKESTGHLKLLQMVDTLGMRVHRRARPSQKSDRARDVSRVADAHRSLFAHAS